MTARQWETELDGLIQKCLAKGWMVRFHNHPKTRANW